MKKIVLLVIFALLISPISVYSQPILMADAVDPVNQDNKAPGEVSDGYVSLDFKDADIQSVLRVIALKSGVNIVSGPEVAGEITIRLKDVPWEKALQVVLKTYGYVFERDGNIVRVTTIENLEKEPLETEAFFLNYSKSNEIASAVSELLSERGRVKAVNRTNTVIVTDLAANIYKIKQVIKNLDKRTPQASIDAKIVRTQLDDTENLGIDWNIIGSITGSSRPTTFPFKSGTNSSLASSRPLSGFLPIQAAGGAVLPNAVNPRDFPNLDAAAANIVNNTFTLGALNFSQFSAILQMLKARTNTKIVSNPRVVVLNNETAKIQVGQEVYIPKFELNEQTGAYVVNDFEVRDTGVIMNVTPHINTANEIMVEVKPEVVTFLADRVIIPGVLTAPQFSTTEAETQVLIKDGETIAIGGLLSDNEATTYNRVPFLGNIPWVGKAFRSKREVGGVGNQKIETIFFITVNIVDTEGQRVDL